MNQIKLNKKHQNLDHLEFYTKCNFCHVLHEKNNENKCDFCFKYLSYVKEQNVVLFTLKNLIINLKNYAKVDKDISLHDFFEVENQMIDISEKNASFTYNKKNLTWHIDCGLFVNKEENFNLIKKTCLNICSCFCTKFKNSITFTECVVAIEDFFKNLNLSNNLRFGDRILAINNTGSNLYSYLLEPASSYIAFLPRHIVFKNFYENLNF